jgi:septum site-determining protein MinC
LRDTETRQARAASAAPQGAGAPAKLRGGTFTLMVLDVPDPARADPLSGVEAKLRQAPSFFEEAPLVLDLQAVPEDAGFDLADAVARLRTLGFVPVGVQNAGDALGNQALTLGLCPFPAWRSGRQRPARDPGPKPDAGADADGESQRPEREAPPPPPAKPAKLVTQPVRSGKRVYARGGDLVAVAPISAGAELIADGHVHVYGALRGRALAGVNGDEGARIFCQKLDAELVSIAGAYRVREDIDEALIGQAVQIYLRGDDLIIDPLAGLPGIGGR